MFNSKNAINAYVSVDNNLTGASFEKRWFESVISIIKRIMAGEFDPVTNHKRLLEIAEGLQWVQENLNEKLNSQHRTMLKTIYSTNIQILNGAIQSQNFEYLPLVIASMEVILGPYNRIPSAESAETSEPLKYNA
ncbi:hypothetical protein G6722_01480 [Polynucleobacter paneuropaeus]|nr:hypothetical protein [Polynucleobacter paneuropaeus]